MKMRWWGDYVQVLSRWVITIGGIMYVQTQHTTTIQTIAVFFGSIAALVLVEVGIDALRRRHRPT
jgi:hypothetical protein